MAPTSSLPSAGGAVTALVIPSWLKWSLLALFAVLLVSLAALALVWIYNKTKESISMFIGRLHERKLVLPTYLDPRMSRPIALPLPQCFATTTQAINTESLTLKNGRAKTLVAGQLSCPLWLSTSLDHIALDDCSPHEEIVHDVLEACDIPALSPSLDADNDSDDSSLQTPPLENTLLPVSHSTKDSAVVDDNYGSAADFFGNKLAPSPAFFGSLCHVDLNTFDTDDESYYALDGSCSFGDTHCDIGIPTIVISEDLDDTSPCYPYESRTLPSTPSTAALYTLGLPITAHEYPPPPGPSPAPIPIPFSPTLSADHYIYVPPPGSPEYFYSSESASARDEEPEPDEEPPTDLSRLGLLWSTSDSSNVASEDNPAFDWNRLLAQEAELDEEAGNSLRSAFSTDSDLVDGEEEDEDEEEEDADSDEEPPPGLSHLGLRSTSDTRNVASDDGGVFSWDRMFSQETGVGQQTEDSGLRSAFSTDSDLAIEDDDDEDEEDEEDNDDGSYP